MATRTLTPASPLDALLAAIPSLPRPVLSRLGTSAVPRGNDRVGLRERDVFLGFDRNPNDFSSRLGFKRAANGVLAQASIVRNPLRDALVSTPSLVGNWAILAHFSGQQLRVSADMMAKCMI